MSRNLMLLGLFSIGALSVIQADEPAKSAAEVAHAKEKEAPAHTPAQMTDSTETTQADEPKAEETNEEKR